jgi:hypothetical protein
MTVPSTYVLGELVDVAIRGARIEGKSVSTGELTIAVGADPEIVLPPSHLITITRVASAEWPPQPGDIWSDRDGEWMGMAAPPAKAAMLFPLDGENAYRQLADDVLREHGPLTLERRRGWTPAAPVAPEEPADPTEAEERTASIAGLRELADLLEAHPELALPYEMVRGMLVVEIDADEQRRQFDAWAPMLTDAAEEARRNDAGIDLSGRVGAIGIKVIGHKLSYRVAAESDEQPAAVTS